MTAPHWPEIILASASPRRREILAAAGLRCTVQAANIQEEPAPGETPLAYARRLAREKAEAVPVPSGGVVLGADTVVVLDQHLLEKPRDAADARRILSLLSGRVHEVITGVCLRSVERTIVDTERTLVSFVELTGGEIEEYVASGEPMDKAGAYGIQGRASKFIHRVEGCYFNVVGLPVALVYRHLKTLTAAGTP